MSKKAVILLSGGLDSATCLAIAHSEGLECYALSFDYGQKHHHELLFAKKIAQFFQVKEHKIFKLESFGGSALTEVDIKVADYQGDTDLIPATYVPARNTVFLSIALGWAEVLGATDILLGCSSIDYSKYPDCRPEYIAAFQNLARLATKEAVNGQMINIRAPLMNLTKAETVKLGCSLGVDYRLTVSCYRLDSKGAACGRCDSCHFRKKGFIEAGIEDPTQYC